MNKIYAYVLNGTPVSDIGQFNSENIDGPAYVVGSEVIPSGYEDITSIKSWHNYYHAAGKDYKYMRDRIKEIIWSNGYSVPSGRTTPKPNSWDSMSISDKSIASQVFVVQQPERSEIYSIEQQVQLGLQFHLNSVESRQTRTMYASMEIYNRLPKENADQVVLDAEDLLFRYITFGREGTNSGDPEGLFDYITAASGTTYESTGLLRQNCKPIGMSIQDFVNKLVDIVGYGNYP